MDGCFQTLDGESMEVKVDEFFREIFKMLKFFQQKQIKAEQEKEKAAGRSESKEEAPKKQDSPTTQLCNIVMEQVKDFKVQIKLKSSLVQTSFITVPNLKHFELFFVSTGAHPGCHHPMQPWHQHPSLGADV